MTLQRFTSFGMLALLLGLPARGSAQVATEAHIQDLIRAAAERAGVQASAPAGSQQPVTPADGSRPAVNITLDEAIKLALDRNLDIAVQRLNPQTFDFSLAAFTPSTDHADVHRRAAGPTNPSTQTIAGAPAGLGIETTTTNWNGGVAQNIPWGGGGWR